MIDDILNSYQFRGRLRRFPFVLSFFTVSAVFSFVAYVLRRSWISGGDDIYMMMAISAEILMTFLVLPLCAARLRDIGWSQYLSGLVLFSLVFSPRLMIIATLNSWGIISSDYWRSGANTIGSTILLFLLFLLVFIKGAPGR